MKTVSLCVVVSVMSLLCGISYAADTDAMEPYGVCSHLGGGEEHVVMPENLRLMHDAGIRWARADFTWSYFESPQGTWKYKNYDRVFEEAEKAGISILPILDYNVGWATPAYKHLDLWLAYVENVVRRYKDRARFWEVWNEQNLKGFWVEEPDPAYYAQLLKATYRKIKEIDPNLQVVYGGLAGVPHDFFEKSLEAGAGPCFDVINIHPYRGGLINQSQNERFVADIQKFNELMAKHKLPKRPIWITEMGWTTPPFFGGIDKRIVEVATRIVATGSTPKVVGALCDERYPSSLPTNVIVNSVLPDGYTSEIVTLEGMKTLDPAKVPFLYMPPGEVFPSQYFDAMKDYVKRGGTLVLTGGAPLYYETEKSEDGTLHNAKNACSGRYRDGLRVGMYAWWTRKGTPEKAPVVVADGIRDMLPGFEPKIDGARFLDDSRLKKGDTMVPLFMARTKDFSAPAVVLYRFGSDWKGNLLVSTLPGGGFSRNESTVEDQGVFLPQAYLMAFAAGVERFFWYEFQATELDKTEREHYFGIVHRDLTPKPGYIAYKTLTKARPNGSVTVPGWRCGPYCVVQWKRPDGRNGWALWYPVGVKKVSVAIKGTVSEAFDNLGHSLPITEKDTRLELSGKILYLIGPDSIELE